MLQTCLGAPSAEAGVSLEQNRFSFSRVIWMCSRRAVVFARWCAPLQVQGAAARLALQMVSW